VDSSWLEIRGWIDAARDAGRKVDVFEVAPGKGVDAARVIAGGKDGCLDAVIAHAGGVQVDHGWLRLLGSGSGAQPRSIGSWNVVENRARLAGAVLVGDDVLGGFFAIDGGGLNGAPGEVFYFAPDTLAWEGLDIRYGSFLKWILSDTFHDFYADFRWPGWEAEVRSVSSGQALSVYPPLWAKGEPIGKRSRKAVPLEEAYSLSVGK
jgi:hypothetical protein